MMPAERMWCPAFDVGGLIPSAQGFYRAASKIYTKQVVLDIAISEGYWQF